MYIWENLNKNKRQQYLHIIDFYLCWENLTESTFC